MHERKLVEGASLCCLVRGLGRGFGDWRHGLWVFGTHYCVFGFGWGLWVRFGPVAQDPFC